MQIKRISVKEVTSPIIFDNLKNAVIGGLYDPAFGPMDPRETCRTCGLNSYECPGHFGHVEVSVPLYNPLVFMTLFKVLRTSCMHCFKFRMTDYEMGQFCERFELLRGGELVEAMVRCVVVRISQLVSRISYLAPASLSPSWDWLLQTTRGQGACNWVYVCCCLSHALTRPLVLVNPLDRVCV